MQRTSANGTTLKNYDYDAFGVERDMEVLDNNPFRYCGEYYEKESKTYYLRARYYNPRTGRFGAEDPAKDGLNWYTYCGGNPILFVDPTGSIAITLTLAGSYVFDLLLTAAVTGLLVEAANQISTLQEQEPNITVYPLPEQKEPQIEVFPLPEEQGPHTTVLIPEAPEIWIEQYTLETKDPKDSIYTFPGESTWEPGQNILRVEESDHARGRKNEGKPVGNAQGDIAKAGAGDILIQDDGRWIVQGKDGRIHVIEEDGSEIVTSFHNPARNTETRINDGRWEHANSDDIKRFSETFGTKIKY